MIKATIRDHKNHVFILEYCKDRKELTELLNNNWKTYSLIKEEKLEDIEGDNNERL